MSHEQPNNKPDHGTLLGQPNNNSRIKTNW